MNTAISAIPTPTPPSAPGTLTATGGLELRVARPGAPRPTTSASPVQRLPLDHGRLHAERGEPDRAADRHELHGHELAPGTYYYRVTAEDAAGNISTASNEASAVVTGDTQAPSTPCDAQRDRIAQLRRAQLARLDGQRRRHALQRLPRDDLRIHAERREPDRTADRDVVQRHRARAGTYYYRVTAEDAAGNVSAASNEASAVVTGGHDGADALPPISRGPGSFSSVASRGPRRPTTSPSLGTTCIARTTAGFTPSAANRIAQPTGTSYSDPGLAARHVLLRGDRRGRRRQHQHRVQRGERRPSPATSPRHRRRRPDGDGQFEQRRAGLDGVDGQRRRHSVQRPPLDDQRLHAERREQDRPADGHELHRSRSRAGHVLLQGHRRGRSREHQRTVCAGDRDGLHGAARRASSPRTRWTRAAARRSATRRARTRARSPAPRGHRPASSVQRSRSTGRAASSTSRTRAASISRPP